MSETQPEDTRNEEQIKTQTATINVVVNDDEAEPLPSGTRAGLEDEPEKTGKVVNVSSYLNLRTGEHHYSIIGHLLNVRRSVIAAGWRSSRRKEVMSVEIP